MRPLRFPRPPHHRIGENGAYHLRSHHRNQVEVRLVRGGGALPRSTQESRSRDSEVVLSLARRTHPVLWREHQRPARRALALLGSLRRRRGRARLPTEDGEDDPEGGATQVQPSSPLLLQATCCGISAATRGHRPPGPTHPGSPGTGEVPGLAGAPTVGPVAGRTDRAGIRGGRQEPASHPLPLQASDRRRRPLLPPGPSDVLHDEPEVDGPEGGDPMSFRGVASGLSGPPCQDGFRLRRSARRVGTTSRQPESASHRYPRGRGIQEGLGQGVPRNDLRRRHRRQRQGWTTDAGDGAAHVGRSHGCRRRTPTHSPPAVQGCRRMATGRHGSLPIPLRTHPRQDAGGT